MKIAFISQQFDSVLPPNQNSLGIWTYEVARRLAADSETMVVSRRAGDQPDPVDVDGARFETLKCLPQRVWTRASKAWDRTFPATPLFTRQFYALDYLAQAVRRVRRIGPDVIHIQNFPTYVPVFRRAFPDAAIVLHMHCSWLSELDRATMARSLAGADVVVGCSGHVIEAARRRFPELGTRFSVLPNGAPELLGKRPAPERDPGKVLFVGRLSPEKGLHTLMAAWPKVVAACPQARLELVGQNGETAREFLVDLSDDPDVQALARFYPGGNAYRGTYQAALEGMLPPEVRDTVTFAGGQPYERVTERYASASLLVNPSLSESFGMSLVEALTFATPVVATNVGGMTEIIRSTGGGDLVRKNDPDALAAAIIERLRHPAESMAMGRRGAERVSELYSWPRIAELTRDVHRKALASRRSRHPLGRSLAPVGDRRTAS